MAAAGDPLTGLLAGRTSAEALATIGLTVPRPELVFCEPQVGAQCGQHAINNLLQEAKCIRIETDPINLIVGPRSECRSIVDLLRQSTIKINMRALCSINDDYCVPPRLTFYSDDALNYILKNILRYSTEYFLTFDRNFLGRMQFVNNVMTAITQPRILGCLLNQGNSHWTAITKFADSAAACPGRQYVFLDSMNPTRMVCLNEVELRNFLHVKYDASNLQSAYIIIHTVGVSYKSVASERLLLQLSAPVAPTAAIAATATIDRFGRAYELYREFVNNSRSLQYMRNNPREFPINSVIKPALRAQNINDAAINLYLNEPTMTINQYKNLVKGTIEPAPAKPITITPEYIRARLLDLYSAYTNNTRKLNNLKKLAVRDLPESEIRSKLKDQNVRDEFIDAYIGSNMSLNQLENFFSPPSPPPPPVPKPINRTRRRGDNAAKPKMFVNTTPLVPKSLIPITTTRNTVNAPPVPKPLIPITKTRRNVNEVKRKMYANAALRLKRK